MTTAQDIVGERYGMLTVVQRDGYIGTGAAWICKCDCGGSIRTRTSALNNGHAQSCGCRRGGITHGHTKNRIITITFSTWQSMLMRCKSHKSYAGKGIKVCDRWKHSFENFLADMGERPSLEHTLDRYPNAAGDYEPSNCRWATKVEQANNRCTTNVFDYNGRKVTLNDLCAETGISYERLRHRIVRAGWPVELAVTTPPSQGQRVMRCNITNS